MLHPLSKVAIASAILSLLKLVVFVLSGSLVILVSFFDSLVDSCMSWLNGRVMRLAQEEPDVEHPYGHGGFEVFASAIQGALLTLFAGFVFLEILQELVKLFYEQQPLTLDRNAYILGVIVLVFSAICGYAFQAYLKRQQMKEIYKNSLSIAVDRAHYFGDFAMNLTSALGLALSWYFDNPWVDRAFAAVGGTFLLYAGLPILQKSFKQISQESLSDKFKKDIVAATLLVDKRIFGVHRLRTRRSGPDLFADFHLKLPDAIPLNEAHEISYKVSKVLRAKFERLDLVIHLDPISEPDDDLWTDDSYKAT